MSDNINNASDNLRAVAQTVLSSLNFSISGYSRFSNDSMSDESNDEDKKAYSLSSLPADYSSVISDLMRIYKPIGRPVMFQDSQDDQVQFDIPDGVTVIFGPSNSGKTSVANYLFDHIPGQKTLVRFHEPDLPVTIDVHSTLDRIWKSLIDDSTDVIIVDSFKFFAYNGGSRSAAMAGGISPVLFTELTNLSIIASAFGKSLIIILNFLSDSDKSSEIVKNAAIGSVSGVILTQRAGDRIFLNAQSRFPTNNRNPVNLYLPLPDKDKSEVLTSSKLIKNNGDIDQADDIPFFITMFRS